MSHIASESLYSRAVNVNKEFSGLHQEREAINAHLSNVFLIETSTEVMNLLMISADEFIHRFITEIIAVKEDAATTWK